MKRSIRARGIALAATGALAVSVRIRNAGIGRSDTSCDVRKACGTEAGQHDAVDPVELHAGRTQGRCDLEVQAAAQRLAVGHADGIVHLEGR